MKRPPSLFDSPAAQPARKCKCGRSLPRDQEVFDFSTPNEGAP